MPKIYAAPRAFAGKPPSHEAIMEQLASIQATLDRIHKTLDEFARVLLDAKFPYGRSHDSFSRRYRH